jgi:hypothetical protein
MTKRHASRSIESDSRKKKRIRGIVAAKKCKYCGHHEIGLIINGGRYVPLIPGMEIEGIKD